MTNRKYFQDKKLRLEEEEDSEEKQIPMNRAQRRRMVRERLARRGNNGKLNEQNVRLARSKVSKSLYAQQHVEGGDQAG